MAFAVLGVLAGVLFAAGPLLGARGSVRSFLAAAFLGLLVATVHCLNLKRLLRPNGSSPPWMLLRFNSLLLAFFVLGFVGLCRRASNLHDLPLIMAAYVLLGPLPFAVNLLDLYRPYPTEPMVPARRKRE